MGSASSIRTSFVSLNQLGVRESGIWYNAGGGSSYPLYPGPPTPTVEGGWDPFDEYAPGPPVLEIDGGDKGYCMVNCDSSFNGPWISRDSAFPQVMGYSWWDDSTLGSDVDGDEDGIKWSNPWVVRETYSSVEIYGYSYFDDATLGDLNSQTEGIVWTSGWIERESYSASAPQLYAYSYFGDATLGGIDGSADGVEWASAWVSRGSATNQTYGYDPFDSYTTSVSVNGKNGGSDWAGAWVSR